MQNFDVETKLKSMRSMAKAVYVADQTSTRTICHVIAARNVFEIVLSDRIEVTAVPLSSPRFSSIRHVYSGNLSEISWDQMVSAVADNLVDVV
jgi:hypothetical protein